MVGLNNQSLKANKSNTNSENSVQRTNIFKNLFKVALLQENIRRVKKAGNLTDEAKVHLLDRSERFKCVIPRDSWRFGYIFNQKNMIEVLKHVAAFAFILVIIYIMYLVLDMAFGPKTYKTKRSF